MASIYRDVTGIFLRQLVISSSAPVFAGLAAEVQSSHWIWGEVLLVPDVASCGLHGVEAMF